MTYLQHLQRVFEQGHFNVICKELTDFNTKFNQAYLTSCYNDMQALSIQQQINHRASREQECVECLLSQIWIEDK